MFFRLFTYMSYTFSSVFFVSAISARYWRYLYCIFEVEALHDIVSKGFIDHSVSSGQQRNSPGTHRSHLRDTTNDCRVNPCWLRQTGLRISDTRPHPYSTKEPIDNTPIYICLCGRIGGRARRGRGGEGGGAREPVGISCVSDAWRSRILLV